MHDSVGTAVYRSVMADAVPDGVPPEATEAARSTLSGAVAVAGQLGDHLGAELLSMAREAFIQSFELTAAIGAAVALGTSLLAAVVLPRVRAGEAPEGQPDREHAVQRPTSPV